jgi:uncharacterized protein YegP (UPF0339 family)
MEQHIGQMSVFSYPPVCLGSSSNGNIILLSQGYSCSRSQWVCSKGINIVKGNARAIIHAVSAHGYNSDC